LLGLAACSSDPVRAPGTEGPQATPTGSGGAAGGSGGGVDAARATGGSSNGGSSNADAASPDSQGDATTDSPIFVIHSDSGGGPGACTTGVDTLGSIALLAGGATPSAFVDAYNAELAKLLTAGPFLIALAGINDTNASGWIAAFGALGTGEAGAGVAFAGNHAEVPFTIGPARSLQIARTNAAFELRFTAPASTALLPVVSVELSGTLSPGCGSLTVTTAKLLIPASAGGLAFHASTLAALMGAATESYQGASNNAWPLELAGKAQQVYAPGVLADGGTEP
jgi:hypothetical protein